VSEEAILAWSGVLLFAFLVGIATGIAIGRDMERAHRRKEHD